MSGNATTFAWREEGTDERVAWTEAAQLLDVPAETLARWSQQFAFPSNVGAAPDPCFRRREIEALRTTLPSAHSVEGAIREAQRKLGVA